MRVLVSGSRDWGDERTIRDRLCELIFKPEEVTILHGACSREDPTTKQEMSADMLADAVAHYCGFEVEPFPADWARYGKRAGYVRNIEMLDTHPDLVLAFQRGGSRGTQHTIDEARRRGIPVEVFTA